MGLSMDRVFDVTTAQRTAGAALSQAPSSPAGCQDLPPGGGEVRDLSVSRGGSVPEPFGLSWAVEHTGATRRQVDWWSRAGLLGEEMQMPGSGSRRSFSTRDLEAMFALRQLADLGCTRDWLAAGTAAVRAAPVDVAGERLVVFLDGSAYRMPVGSPISAEGPLWQVPLRSFAGVRP